MERITITNVTGIVLAILTIVTGYGVISSEEAAVLTKWLPVLIEGIGSIVLLFLARDKKDT